METSPAPVPPMPHGKFARGARDMSLTKAMKEKGRPKAGGLARQVSGGELAEAGGASIEDLNLLPSSTQSGMNAKQVPDLDNGFLVQVSGCKTASNKGYFF